MSEEVKESPKAEVKEEKKKGFFGKVKDAAEDHEGQLEAISTMAHKHGVPVIVDNTVATPVLLEPFDYGADIVVHSLTK